MRRLLSSRPACVSSLSHSRGARTWASQNPLQNSNIQFWRCRPLSRQQGSRLGPFQDLGPFRGADLDPLTKTAACRRISLRPLMNALGGNTSTPTSQTGSKPTEQPERAGTAVRQPSRDSSRGLPLAWRNQSKHGLLPLQGSRNRVQGNASHGGTGGSSTPATVLPQGRDNKAPQEHQQQPEGSGAQRGLLHLKRCSLGPAAPLQCMHSKTSKKGNHRNDVWSFLGIL